MSWVDSREFDGTSVKTEEELPRHLVIYYVARLRERLVAIVGHDLRTPLFAISMAAEMLSPTWRPPTSTSSIASNAARTG